MDDKNLEMLEFPKVREILAGFTSFSASRELALSLRPSSDAALIVRLLGESAEARRLLSLEPDFSIKGALDIREAARMAARGKMLEPQVLVDVQMTLGAIRYVRNGVRKLDQEIRLLWDIASGLVELPYLEDEIAASISSTGEVLDSASPRLGDLRSRVRDAQQQLVERLEAICKSPRGRRALQDSYVTEREGRYVLPLKADFRREIRGLVHDVSNTGATLFVEPWSTVELGNEVRELRIEENREVERILMALSAGVGANEEAISRNVTLVAELDLALAKAKYADRVRAVEPAIEPRGSDGGETGSAAVGVARLVNARHPLLGDKAVPLSLEIGDDYSVLVITGPNTGGKTVALKTVGLLALMAQAGIPIPASDGSSLPVFDGVYADIGDEQSIEQTLSSFSWHMGNIVRIIRTSTERSLILLDELGTSTDPNEGSALARSILLHFLSRRNAVVATTHYSELKVFAHSTPGMRNASLDFDPATLAPTYHLTMGIPGGSNALAIASQLGLEPDIVAAAREMMAKGTEGIEVLLADLMSDRQRTDALNSGLEEAKRQAEAARRRLQEELERRKVEDEKFLREARDSLNNDVVELRREMRRAASELRKQESRESVEQAEKAMAAARRQLGVLTSKIREGRAEVSREPARIEVGDRVWLTDISTWGDVLSIREEEGEIDVQVGSTRLSMGLEDAEKLKPPEGKKLPERRSSIRKRLVDRDIKLELDLRGRRADEVASELEVYLNSASLANLGQVRIIHGFGTGTVRQIVREILGSHSLVKSFRPGEQGEGGDGVTVVKL